MRLLAACSFDNQECSGHGRAHGHADARLLSRRLPEPPVARFMSQEHRLENDLVALALMALVVFLAIALGSYSSADPVADMVSPLRVIYQPDRLCWSPELANGVHRIANLGGRWGALLADVLLSTIGLGAYYAVGCAFLAAVRLLRRRPLSAPLLRSLGWLASLAGLVAAVNLWAPQWTPGPIVGGGGYLGELLGRSMDQHFTEAGSMILCGSLFLGGLLVYVDAGWWRGAGALAVMAMFGLARGGKAAGTDPLAC